MGNRFIIVGNRAFQPTAGLVSQSQDVAGSQRMDISYEELPGNPAYADVSKMCTCVAETRINGCKN